MPCLSYLIVLLNSWHSVYSIFKTDPSEYPGFSLGDSPPSRNNLWSRASFYLKAPGCTVLFDCSFHLNTLQSQRQLFGNPFGQNLCKALEVETELSDRVMWEEVNNLITCEHVIRIQEITRRAYYPELDVAQCYMEEGWELFLYWGILEDNVKKESQQEL